MLKNLAITLVVLAALVLSPAAVAKGKLGFATEVAVSGLFKPVLKRVKVSSVTPGSPAAAAGLQVGDYVVEVDGRQVQGAPAREMAARLKAIKTGEHLLLELKRGTEIVAAEIVAAP